jgi:hypothetical protein
VAIAIRPSLGWNGADDDFDLGSPSSTFPKNRISSIGKAAEQPESAREIGVYAHAIFSAVIAIRNRRRANN